MKIIRQDKIRIRQMKMVKNMGLIVDYRFPNLLIHIYYDRKEIIIRPYIFYAFIELLNKYNIKYTLTDNNYICVLFKDIVFV